MDTPLADDKSLRKYHECQRDIARTSGLFQNGTDHEKVSDHFRDAKRMINMDTKITEDLDITIQCMACENQCIGMQVHIREHPTRPTRACVVCEDPDKQEYMGVIWIPLETIEEEILINASYERAKDIQDKTA